MNDNFVQYMHFIAEHPIYSGMPGAINPKTKKVSWQTSNSPKVDFFKFYNPRFDWWVAKADELGVPGEGKSDDRFAITARMIHPTGKRPCLFCGVDFSVGFYYLNANSAKRFTKEFGDEGFLKGQPIDEAIQLALFSKGQKKLSSFLQELFPERNDFFDEFGYGADAFDRSIHLRSSRLSPGFMSNCPYRLDGFHDYAGPCGHRGNKDTGRHDSNMKTYNHDRRAFEWWAAGDWNLADALYNLAGPGSCSICGKDVPKVSPDHIGPLACGFKHMPFFSPMCTQCNSSKNRYMTLDDVRKLIQYEEKNHVSVASPHIQHYWDSMKNSISSDAEAHDLSNKMRTIEDFYLRCLHRLKIDGFSSHIIRLVEHHHAFHDFHFKGLDSSNLTFESFDCRPNNSNGRRSLASRSIRIGMDALDEYAVKHVNIRRLSSRDVSSIDERLDQLSISAKPHLSSCDGEWHDLLNSELDRAHKDLAISKLLDNWNDPGTVVTDLVIKATKEFSLHV